MGAELWMKLKETVRTIRPDLEKEFNNCRDRTSIEAFMNKNFPLSEAMVGKNKTDWKDHMSVKIPEIIAEHKGKDKKWDAKS